MKLYQEQLMDHYRNPRHRTTLEAPDFTSAEHNPSCGDSVSFQGSVALGHITALAFQGKGCVISQGASSMLAAHCTKLLIDDIAKLDKEFMLTLVGIPLGPTRLRCALLPLQALQQGIADYQNINS